MSEHNRPDDPAPTPEPQRKPALHWLRPQQAPAVQDERVVAFLQALGRFTPKVLVTKAIIVANVAYFVVMVVGGVHPFSPNAEALVRWGATFGPFTASGEWWRLGSAMFIHIGVLHLLMNMWVLWTAGPLVERLLGNAGFLLTYLLSGLFGGLASLWWNPEVVSAGASGAVFGVYGALMVFLLVRRRLIPMQVLQGLRSSTLVFVAYNLVFGLMHKGIDMAAHLGGLVAGFACALPLCHPLTEVAWRGRGRRNLVVLLAGGALVAALAWVQVNDVAEMQREIDRFVVVEKRSIARYNEALKKVHRGQLTDPELARAMRAILPEWRRAGKRLAAFRNKKLPTLYQKKVDRLQRYITLREQGWRMFAEALEQRDKAKAERAMQVQSQAEKVLEEGQNPRSAGVDPKPK